MATTYAIPIDASIHNHHNHGHARSHNRRSTIQRQPLQPTSVNGSLHFHPGSPEKQSLDILINTQPVFRLSPQKSSDSLKVIDQRQTHSLSQLPTSKLDTAKLTNVRSKSMERRAAGLPTHLNLQNQGYGFPSATLRNQDSAPKSDEGAARTWITVTEVISAVFVPLPYVLISLSGTSRLPTHSSEEASTVAEVPNSIVGEETVAKGSITALQPGMLTACALTSAALLLVGIAGKISGTPKTLDRRKGSLGNGDGAGKTQKALLTLPSARRILYRVLSVGLPFFANAQLGGERTALIMLCALATDLKIIDSEGAGLTTAESWKRLLASRRWTLGVVLAQVLCDVTGLTINSTAVTTWTGYLALLISILILPPPFPSSKSNSSIFAAPTPRSAASTSAVLATPWESPQPSGVASPKPYMISPLLCTSEDVDLTLCAGILLGFLSCASFFVSTHALSSIFPISIVWVILASSASALSMMIAHPQSIRNSKGLGLALGIIFPFVLFTTLLPRTLTSITFQGVFACTSWAASKLDTHSSISLSSQSEHHHHHHVEPHNNRQDKPSRLTTFLLHTFQHWSLLHSILVEKDSRRIFYFMSLNFAFMLVQTFYGLATGSLGLLSDSIHMFFDCLALVVGLCASVMSKWPPSTRFPYGYGKMDTLAGFANGIFLMLISVEIIYEAIERLAEGSEMQRIGELLTVSSLGLVVNLIGMTAFGHAHHGHSHGGHDHSHGSHGNEAHHHTHEDHHHHHHEHHEHHDGSHLHNHLHADPTSLPYSVPATPSKPLHPDSRVHGGQKHHPHGNENMHGIYLHIVADTLGSVAVVISTLLIHFYGWSGFDPLASCLIAILIFASAVPLVSSSAKILLLTVPEDTEFDLREALAGISGLKGVTGYTVPRFWLEEGEERRVLGVVHVMAGRGVDLDDVKERAVGFLRGRGMDILVQVEREGDGRCWCGGGVKVA